MSITEYRILRNRFRFWIRLNRRAKLRMINPFRRCALTVCAVGARRQRTLHLFWLPCAGTHAWMHTALTCVRSFIVL